jgi:hypothetical protein
MRLCAGYRFARCIWLVGLSVALSACGGGGGGSNPPGGNPPPTNNSPVASAGIDQTVFKSEAVQLDGSASNDPDGDQLTYTWVQQSGPAVTLSSASSARPTLTAPVTAGQIVLALTVSDGTRTSTADSVTIEVLNRVPAAAAGADVVAEMDSLVTLDASGSIDPDNDTLTYAWTQTHGAPVVLTQLPNGNASFRAPYVVAVLQFRLIVSDGDAVSSDDTVLISIGGAGPAPFIDAGFDTTAPRNSQFVLSGWIWDASGTNVEVNWRQISGTSVTLSHTDSAWGPTFQTPDTEGDLVFELSASNAFMAAIPDQVVISIRNFGPYVNISLSPAQPRTLEDLVATVDAFDGDGDQITLAYAWRRNGTTIPGFSATTLPHTQHAKNDLIEFVVSASDGVATNETIASVTIRDTPTQFTATPPTTVDWGDTFTFTLTATDVDEEDTTGAFELRHGPAGMSVTSAGIVTWVAELPMFGTSLDVNYGIALTGNEAVYAGTVRVMDSDRAPPMRRSGIEVAPRDGALQIVDLDGDGDREVLMAGSATVAEYAWNGTDYEQRWSYPFHLGNEYSVSVAAADVMGSVLSEIFIASGEQVLRLDGPFRTTGATLSLPDNTHCRKIELADVNSNGSLEIVCLLASPSSWYNNSVLVANATTMQTLYQTVEFGNINVGSSSLAVGNVDNDAALEIVTATGYVFDGSTGLTQWTYGPGFGHVDTGDLDGDGREEIVGVYGVTRVFDAVQRTPLWELPGLVGPVILQDIEGTAAVEIIGSSGGWGQIVAYRYEPSSSTYTVELFRISAQGYDVGAIATGDVDDDGQVEIVWSSDIGSSGPDSFVVAGRNPAIAIEWVNDDPQELDGPFIGGQLAMLEPGQARLLFSSATDNGYGGSRLVAMHPQTGALEVSSELDTSWSGIIAHASVDYDDDGYEEVFLGSSDTYWGRFTAYDFASDIVEWTSAQGAGAANAVAYGDFNSDGFDDMVAIGGQYINVYDVRNSNLLWRSVSFTDSAIDVQVADMDADGTPEIIAATSSRVVIYRRGTIPAFVESASLSVQDQNQSITDLLVADTNGDDVPEVFLLAPRWSYEASIYRLSNQLEIQASFLVSGAAVNSIHLEQVDSDHRNLIIGAGESYYWSMNPPRLRAIDPWRGTEVWSSPALGGTTPRNSLFYVDPDADGELQISFGGGAGMYLTR